MTTLIAIIQNVWPEGHVTHGMFTTVEKAVKGYQQLVDNQAFYTKEVWFEEIPLDQPLFWQDTDADTYFNSCIRKYHVDGTLIEEITYRKPA